MEPLVKCLSPRLVVNKYTKQEFYSACGHCEACLLRRSQYWSFRVNDECKQHRFSLFFTLTYDNNHIPRLHVSSDSENTYVHNDSLDLVFALSPDVTPKFISNDGNNTDVGILSKRDIQKFLKRLRINIHRKFHKIYPNEDQSIRYFIAGEYGPRTLRPHYHGIIWTDSALLADWLKCNIHSSWQMCRASYTKRYVSFVSSSAAQYVAAYTNGLSRLPSYLQDKQTKPFHLCSKNPPIGFFREDKAQIYEAILSGCFTIPRRDDKTKSLVDEPIPTYLASKYFPRCRNFGKFTPVQRVKIYSKAFELARKSVIRRHHADGFCSVVPEPELLPFQKFFKGKELTNADLCRKSAHIYKACKMVCEDLDISVLDYVELVDALYKHREQDRLREQIELQEQLITDKLFNKLRYVFPLNLEMASSSYFGRCFKSDYFSAVTQEARKAQQYRRDCLSYLRCTSDFLSSGQDPQRCPEKFAFMHSEDGAAFYLETLSQCQKLSKFKNVNESINENAFSPSPL